MPVFGGLFVAATFASIGLPGFSGFVGEFLALLGAFLTSRWYVVVATTGVILAAVYMLWAVQRAFTGEPDEENARDARDRLPRDLHGRAAARPVAVPRLLPEARARPRASRASSALVHHVEDHSDYKQPAVSKADRSRRRRRSPSRRHEQVTPVSLGRAVIGCSTDTDRDAVDRLVRDRARDRAVRAPRS